MLLTLFLLLFVILVIILLLLSFCMLLLFLFLFVVIYVLLEAKSLHTQLLLLGNNIAITHISYTALIVEELICVKRVHLWCLLVLPL